MVTEQEVTTTTTTTVEEKYRVNAPESMQETFMSDSEDEGGKSVGKVSSSLIEVLNDWEEGETYGILIWPAHNRNVAPSLKQNQTMLRV